MSEHHDTDDYAVHPHISSVKQNTVVLLGLLGLTGLTVAAYNVRLGEANLIVALVIAAIKASLVMAFFMHLKYDRAFNIAVFIGSILFMGVFFGYTANDTEHRGQITVDNGTRVDPRTGAFANGTAMGIVDQGGEMLPLEASGEPEATTPGETEAQEGGGDEAVN